MTAEVLNVGRRYHLFGTRQWYWVPVLANKTAPTRSELDAGTDISGALISQTGFDLTTNFIDTPDAGSDFTSKIPGRSVSADSMLSTYMSEDGPTEDVRSIFVDGTSGFIVIFSNGDVTGGSLDVFPVTVASSTKSPDVEAVASISTGFAITSKPVLDIAVPAHV